MKGMFDNPFTWLFIAFAAMALGASYKSARQAEAKAEMYKACIQKYTPEQCKEVNK